MSLLASSGDNALGNVLADLGALRPWNGLRVNA